MPRFPMHRLTTALLALALAGCDEDSTTGVPRGLVACPTTAAQHASATVPLTGGTVAVAGTSVSIPGGALLAPALIAVDLPVSAYDEVRLTANALDAFTFESAVTVTLDYSRCTAADLDRQPLTVWRIDPSTKAFLEDMQGADDKGQRKVTFQTGHFSSYALAY